MTEAWVLRQAAEQVDSGNECYGCYAILTVAHSAEEAAAALRALERMRPKRVGDCGFWGPDDKASRVIGLLLAAEIVETEGL